jgi:hypothetical protein
MSLITSSCTVHHICTFNRHQHQNGLSRRWPAAGLTPQKTPARRCEQTIDPQKTPNHMPPSKESVMNWQRISLSCLGTLLMIPLAVNAQNWTAAGGELVSCSIQPLAIKIHGNVAVIHHYYYYLRRDSEGEEEGGRVRWTDIMLKQENRWVFIADHGGEDSMLNPAEYITQVKNGRRNAVEPRMSKALASSI